MGHLPQNTPICLIVVVRCGSLVDVEIFWRDGNRWERVQSFGDSVPDLCVVRYVVAAFCMVPPFDLITDVWQVTYYAVSGWVWSTTISVVVVWLSWRFGVVYALLHPKPTIRRIVVLYVPFVLLPWWDIATKPDLESEEDGGDEEEPHERGEYEDEPTPNVVNADELTPNVVNADELTPNVVNDAPAVQQDSERSRGGDGGEDCNAFGDICRSVHKIIIGCTAPYDTTQPPDRCDEDCEIQDLKEPETPQEVERDSQASRDTNESVIDNHQSQADMEHIGGLFNFLCAAKSRDRLHDFLDWCDEAYRESSSRGFKLVLSLCCEIALLFFAVFFGWLLLTSACLTLAKESLIPHRDRNAREETRALYSRVVTFIEGLFESTPQFFLQVSTYIWVRAKGRAQPTLGLSYRLLFILSSLTSISGLLMAVLNYLFYQTQILAVLRTPIDVQKNTILGKVKKNPQYLRRAPARFRAEDSFLAAAVWANPSVLIYVEATRRFVSRKEMALHAVNHDGMLLRFVPTSLKSDFDILYAAIQSNDNAKRFVPDHILNDPNFKKRLQEHKLGDPDLEEEKEEKKLPERTLDEEAKFPERTLDEEEKLPERTLDDLLLAEFPDEWVAIEDVNYIERPLIPLIIDPPVQVQPPNDHQAAHDDVILDVGDDAEYNREMQEKIMEADL